MTVQAELVEEIAEVINIEENRLIAKMLPVWP